MREGRTVGVTSPKDRSGLKARVMHLTEDQLNEHEAWFIIRAQKRFLESAVDSPLNWFNVSFLFEVHKAMLSEVWLWAGKPRKTQKNIGVKPYLIESLLHELCKDVLHWNRASIDMPILEQACRIHHRLVLIHPFEDGNGRFSRLIADRYLKGRAHLRPNWPFDLHVEGEARQKYISALREADAGNHEPLISFTQLYIDQA